jgi:hypothetical protein
MKRKNILLLPFLAALAAIVFSCDDRIPEPANNSLQGTKWKLEGIVNEQTGEMQVLEPIDCEECYTLEFDTDTTACGQTVSNVLVLNLISPPYLGVATEVGEIEDGRKFSDVLFFVTHYEYDSENLKLKFFYKKEEINYVLIFKNLKN